MLLKVRFHGRGGQGVKTSSRILGRAAFYSGYFVQDSPIYGAERRGAPVAAFTRISDEPILERGYIFDPHVVIVMDESLLNDWFAKPLQGLRENGVLFINSPDNIDQPSQQALYRVLRYSLTDEALRFIGKPVISGLAAAAAAKILGFITKDALVEAAFEELVDIGLEKTTVEKNIETVSFVFDAVPSLPIPELEAQPTQVQLAQLDVKSVVHQEITNLGNAYLRKTGNWRLYKPVVDYDKCTGCMICFIYCPESVISLDKYNKPVIDYDNCKGCMICVVECPLKAISVVREAKIFA